MIKDDFKSNKTFPLKSLYFYLTKGCNLKCRHCWIAPEYQSSTNYSLPALDVELMQSIIDQAKPLGLSSIKLTGGEPLLHPQIAYILEIVQTSHFNLVIETNGVLCTPAIAAQIRKSSKNIFVSVSLDGANAETHEWVRGVPGSFDDAIIGVKNLVEVGIKPQIIMSLMRNNVDQIESVIQLAEKLGASSVKYNPVQPTARGDAMHNALETLTIQELVKLGNWVENDLSSTTPLRLIYTHPLAFSPLSKMFGEKGTGCGVCGINNILGVLSDGSYSLCGIGENVPELIFGNANRDKLKDVWSKTSILNELRYGFPDKLEGLCGECLMNNMCKASCVAQNYYTHKNIWASHWYCEEAQKVDLFPTGRLRRIDTSIKEN